MADRYMAVAIVKCIRKLSSNKKSLFEYEDGIHVLFKHEDGIHVLSEHVYYFLKILMTSIYFCFHCVSIIWRLQSYGSHLYV